MPTQNFSEHLLSLDGKTQREKLKTLGFPVPPGDYQLKEEELNFVLAWQEAKGSEQKNMK